MKANHETSSTAHFFSVFLWPTVMDTNSKPNLPPSSAHIVIVGCLVWLGLCVLSLWGLIPQIETSLKTEAISRLNAAKVGGFEVSFKGQKALVSLSPEGLKTLDIESVKDLENAQKAAVIALKTMNGDAFSPGSHFGPLTGPATEIEFNEAELASHRLSLSAPPTEAKLKAAVTCTNDIKSAIRGRKLNFMTNSDKISPESEVILDAIAKAVKSCSEELELHIEGHTDNVGSKDDNQKLSSLRASSAAKALETRGIKQSDLHPKGWGSDKPLSSNLSEAGRAQNRRVEFTLKAL
jgi:outer membrane protein OmpA-like peptidoglycan-associated protein